MNKRYLLIGALVLIVALLISAFSLEAITEPYESEYAQTGGSSSLQADQFPGAVIYPQLLPTIWARGIS
jgi:hypothetical protein